MKIYKRILTLIFFVSIFISYEKTTGQSTGEKDCVPTYDSTLERNVYTFVDEMPQYPGGETKLLDFLIKNTKYPSHQAENDLQSRIYLTFIIEPDGTVSNVNTVKKHNGNAPSLLDEEGIRVLRLMPLWASGKCNGRAVAVKINLPVTVCLH